MYSLRLLGGISLSDDEGHEVDALLRQPKHVALLAYLCLPAPGTWHRRDSVLGTLWPDLQQVRARAALRSALYTVRQHLPDGAIRPRGSDETSAAPRIVGADPAALSDDLASGRYADALARYGGDLLAGVYIADTPEFEEWLALKRRDARGIAQKAAGHLADHLAREGDIPAAIDVARRAAEL